MVAALFTVTALSAQDKDYQRYDLVREKSELTLESAVNLWTEQTNGFDIYSIHLGANIEYTFLKNHGVTLNLPYSLAWYTNPDARPQSFYSFGDLRLSYEYLKQLGHINLFFGPRFSVPLYESTEYAVREGVYAAGNGRYTVGASISATGIRDPVVWTLGFSYDVGLPKQERFSASWLPGNMQLSAGFSDLLNDRFGFAANLYQSVNLPPIAAGVWKPEQLSAATQGKLECFVLFEKDYVRISLEATLYPLNRPFVVGFVYGHQFELNK
jgi:hypothetical protein